MAAKRKRRTFLPHQKKGFDLARTRTRFPLFWEMRLGKTLLTIRWVETLQPPPEKILVVAPLSVLEVWEKELKLEGVRQYQIALLLGSAEQRLLKLIEMQNAKWFLVNYEGLLQRRRPGENRSRPIASEITKMPWHCVILDESTRIRNPRADITKVVQNELGSVPYRTILSGLPNPESALDFFEQMKFINGSFLDCDTYWSFRQRYFQQLYGRWEWVPLKGTISLIKEAVAPFSLTRKQARMGAAKVFETRRVNLPSKMRKLYERAENEYALGLQETLYAPVQRTWCLRIAGGVVYNSEDDEILATSHHKVDELISLLLGELKNQRIVVFFRFNAEINLVAEKLRKKKLEFVIINGSVSRSERIKRRAQIQYSNGTALILCQTRCVQFGLDFSFCPTAIYFSNWDDYEIRAQSEDRIIHPKKKEPSLYIDLVTRESVDEDILDALKDKEANAIVFKSKLIQVFKERRKDLIDEIKKRRKARTT